VFIGSETQVPFRTKQVASSLAELWMAHNLGLHSTAVALRPDVSPIP